MIPFLRGHPPDPQPQLYGNIVFGFLKSFLAQPFSLNKILTVYLHFPIQMFKLHKTLHLRAQKGINDTVSHLALALC